MDALGITNAELLAARREIEGLSDNESLYGDDLPASPQTPTSTDPSRSGPLNSNPPLTSRLGSPAVFETRSSIYESGGWTGNTFQLRSEPSPRADPFSNQEQAASSASPTTSAAGQNSPPSRDRSTSRPATDDNPPTPPPHREGIIRPHYQRHQRHQRLHDRDPPILYGGMNYQNYLDTSQGGSATNPRQAPSPQAMNHANGVNGSGGGLAVPGMMAGLPTPAGHQSDLNYIMTMVEELSGILADNKAKTDNIVSLSGRVRQRALDQNMTNEEVIAAVSNELNETTLNLEEENASLRRALASARHDRDENHKLLLTYAKTMSHMLEQLHGFKEKTVTDMSVWHRSYRNQLAEERRENLDLRCHITDMNASAARGLDSMRKFTRGWLDSPMYHELRVENTYLRQQCRTWKRMALSELPSDDSEFSDDDDVIDPEEKKRLKRLEEEKKLKEEMAAREAGLGGAGDVGAGENLGQGSNLGPGAGPASGPASAGTGAGTAALPSDGPTAV